MVNIIPDDRKDDITYLEEMLQEVTKCLANKVYADWKRTNKLISRDIAMVVTPIDMINYYKNILKRKTENIINNLENKAIKDFDEFITDFKDEN
jgi:hypothetical protein|tara:strand:- start:49 stop:330 length:282 start_codon:yes stop_codon:yes gene_type:complete